MHPVTGKQGVQLAGLPKMAKASPSLGDARSCGLETGASSCVDAGCGSGASAAPPAMSRREHIVAFISFTVLGASAMSFFNSVIQALYSLQVFLFPADVNMSDTLTGVYLTCSLAVTTAMIVLRVLDARLLFVGAAGFTACALALPTIAHFAPDSRLGLVLLHLVLAAGGCCTAAFESSMFSLANIMPVNFAGAACFGLGVSGTLAFGVWFLLSKAIFDESASGTRDALWAFFAFSACINLLSAALFHRLLSYSFTRRSLGLAKDLGSEKKAREDKGEARVLREAAQEQGVAAEAVSAAAPTADAVAAPNAAVAACATQDLCAADANVAVVRDGRSTLKTADAQFTGKRSASQLAANAPLDAKRRRSTWAIFKDAAEPILNVAVTLWLTLMMYPNVAPFSWRMSVTQTDITIGMCTLGDFIGRYIPNLRNKLPWVVVKMKKVKYFTAARLLFIPIFVLLSKIDQTIFPLQMLVGFFFQFSNGWICSLATMYVPDSVEDEDEKAQTSPLYIVCILLGMTLGVWMTKLWKL